MTDLNKLVDLCYRIHSGAIKKMGGDTGAALFYGFRNGKPEVLFQAPFGDGPQKTAAITALRLALLQYRCTEYAISCEMWFKTGSMEDARSPEWQRQMPSQMPDRKEGLVVYVEDDNGEHIGGS